MPFTLSHLAVALPFARSRWLVPSAVAAAALAPDVSMYVPWLRGFAPHSLTHHWVSTWYTALPLAFAMLLAWRLLVRPVLIEWSPRMLAERLPPTWGSAWADGWFGLWGGREATMWARVRAATGMFLGLIIGIVTHILLDQLTHWQGWGRVLLNWNGTHWGVYPVSTWVHIAISLLGLVALAGVGVWLLLRRPIATELDRVVPRWIVRSVWGIAFVWLVARYSMVLSQVPGQRMDYWLPDLINELIVTLSWLFVAVSVSSLVVLLWRGVKGKYH